MTRVTIFTSPEYTLEKISFDIKRRSVYREIIKQNGELEVKELDKPPQWFVRQLKLKYLLDE